MAYISGVAAATPSTLALRDSNGNLFANNVAQGFATTATAGSTTTLTAASAAVQAFTGSANQTVALPSTGIAAGQEFLVLSGTTGTLTVTASGGATVQAVAAGKYVRVTALVATPTLATHWFAEYPPSTTGVTSGAAAANVATNESTTSTSYTDLTTTTDSVAVTVSSSGLVQVNIDAQVLVSGAGTSIAQMAFALSGANTVAASDAYSTFYQGFTSAAGGKVSGSFVLAGLTPGSTTFKAKYKARDGGSGSGTAAFSNRHISVIPL